MTIAGKQKTILDDKGDYPKAQAQALGQVHNVRQITPYGFFCSPPLASSWLLFSVRDNPDDMVGFGHDFANRFKNLLPGECALANTESGAYIKLSASGDIEIFTDKDVNMTCKNANITVSDKATLAVTTSMTVNCPTTTWTGDINVTGDITATNDVKAGAISLNSHTHPVTTAPGTTGVPQ